MKKQLRWKQRFEHFGKALDRLENALEKSSLAELEKDGVLQRFEFTFELSWKTLQDLFEEQGYVDAKGPKKVIQQAFQNGYIQNGEAWMDLLEDRNLLTHTYDQDASERIFDHIQKVYHQLLCDLYYALKKECDA